MIWDSVVVMTIIDLAIIVLTTLALWTFYEKRYILRHLNIYAGALLSLSGLFLIAMFYVADIAVMHVMPLFVAEKAVLSAMSKLHLGYNWIVSTVGIALLTASMIYFNKILYPKVVQIERELKEHSWTDSLTKVFNRSKFDDIIEREIERAKRYDQLLSLIVFDVDHFKAVNDAHGHLFGDSVLQAIAGLARDNIRGVDYLARWGGEEFMIILPETGLERAEALADRIKEEIEHHDFEIDEKVTVSFGVAQFKKYDSKETFIKKADDALYRAKANGRNRVEVSV
jgi:diguanylate cyclase (GGDEF)-like protein